jgi:hypothetical protein
MKVFLLTSSDREHGGKVVHGIFSTEEKAREASSEVATDYYRIPLIEELEMDLFYDI